MPTNRAKGYGSGTYAASQAVREVEFTIALAGDSFTLPLIDVYGLPRIFFYFNQTAGANPATVDLRFTVAQQTGAAVENRILPFSAPFVLPALAVGSITTFDAPVRAITAQITAAVNTTTIVAVYGASS
jgi:hypothetical protein|tara:strand:- start:459 stop:845 length:387 start_codon:yes stop_codon:yes gene_type:complete